MKTIKICAVFVVAALWAVWAGLLPFAPSVWARAGGHGGGGGGGGGGHGGGGGGGRGGGGGGFHGPSFSRSSWGNSGSAGSRSYGSFRSQNSRPYAGRSTGNFRSPTRDFQNHAIGARPVSNIGARGDMVHGTLGNRGVVASVRGAAGMRGDRDGRYHWYNSGGTRFCHWYDRGYGRDWFGFYAGDAFFWSIYWNDYFWWYEPADARWLWYWDGNWWWNAPGGTPEVYVDNGYYSWQQEGDGDVLMPAPAQGAQKPAADQPSYHYSGDGTRLVQVEGAARSAYLYDLTRKDADGNYQMIRYLGAGVSKVQFTNPTYGGAMQIILEATDASGKTTRSALDSNGNSAAVEGAGAAEMAAPPQGIPDPDKLPAASKDLAAPVPASVKPPAAPAGTTSGTAPAKPPDDGD